MDGQFHPTFFLDVISVNKLMCQKVLFGEKDVMELLQKEGQNVNQTISRARSLSKLTIKYYFWKDHDYILWKIGL